MSIEEQIASLNAQLSDAQARLASYRAQKVANELRTADWMRHYRGPGHSSEADAALASCAADKAQIEQQISNTTATIASLTTQLEKAMKAGDAINAALASAAEKGLTGDVALQKAKTQNAVIIAATALVLVVVGLWAWRKFIRKK